MLDRALAEPLCQAILQQGANVNERMKSKDDGAERDRAVGDEDAEMLCSLLMHSYTASSS